MYVRIRRRIDALTSAPVTSVLQHGDPSFRNYLINPQDSSLSAIVDPSAKIGPFIEELAWVYVFMQDADRIGAKWGADFLFRQFIEEYDKRLLGTLDTGFFAAFVSRKYLSRILTAKKVKRHAALSFYQQKFRAFLDQEFEL